MPVARLYTATSLEMPVKVLCGRRAGPVLFVSAAIHGDELNGVEIIRRLLHMPQLQRLAGTLLLVEGQFAHVADADTAPRLANEDERYRVAMPASVLFDLAPEVWSDGVECDNCALR